MQKYSKYLDGKSEIVSILLEELFSELDRITGKDYIVEEKSSSLHIVKGSAFMGIHFLKNRLRLNIVLDHKINIVNLHKVEQVSKSRFHNEVDLDSLEDLNLDLISYIQEAYSLKRTK
jgi:hypothetical protein